MINSDLNTVYMHGEITEDSALKWCRELDQLSNHMGDTDEFLTVNIISNGGDWYASLAVYNRLLSLPQRIATLASGYLSSAATVIYLAGEYRGICPNTTVLIHGGEDVISGGASDVVSGAKESKYQFDLMVEIYTEHTHKSKRFWNNKCKTEYYFHEDEAVKLGYSHEVI